MGKYHDDYPNGRPAWAGLINAIFQQLDQAITDYDDGTRAYETIDVDGGTFDSVTLGGNTPAPATHTTVDASGDLTLGSCLKVTLSFTQLVGTTDTDKVMYDTIALDTSESWDLDNYRLTPTRAGWYMIVQTIGCAASATTKEFKSLIYKNGSVASTQEFVSVGTNYNRICHPVVLQANGSSDYFEGFFYNGDSGSVALGGDEFLAFRMF